MHDASKDRQLLLVLVLVLRAFNVLFTMSRTYTEVNVSRLSELLACLFCSLITLRACSCALRCHMR